MKKLLTALTLSLTITQIQATDSIRFGLEATYPPFEFIGEDNKLTGFDVELANAICVEIKASCSFNIQPFDSLIPGLKFRRIDAVISGMDITPTRLEQVDFSDPYYENSAVFISAKSNNFSKADDFKGKTIGVQNGTTHQVYLIDTLEKQGAKLRPYDNVQNALLDLTNDRVDAVFSDTAVAKDWIAAKGKGKYTTVGKEVKDANYFGIGMGIATRKGNPLVEKLNKGLEKVKLSGVYQKLMTKYFDVISE